MDVVPCVRESLSFRILLRFYTPVMGVPGGEVIAWMPGFLRMTPAGGVHLFRQTSLCLNFQKGTGRLFASLLMRVVVIVSQLNVQGCVPAAGFMHQVIEWITVPPPISTFPYCMMVPAKALKCSHCIPWAMC